MNARSGRNDVDGSATRVPAWLALIAVIVVHTALALPQAMVRRDIRHDEAITLLTITGHAAQYQQITTTETPPHLVWASARDWQRLLVMPADRPPELGVISQDLAQNDIHPPLYFWLFSFVARMFGASLAVGLGMNVMLDGLTILVTYFLAKRIIRSERGAILAAFLWAISPGPIEASLEMRPYALFGLLVPTFVLLAAQVFNSNSRFRILWACALTILCAVGMLTHYYFLLLVLAFFVVVVLSFSGKYAERMQKRPLFAPLGNIVSFVAPADTSPIAPEARRSAVVFVMSSILGVVLGIAAFPHVFEILQRQGSQVQPFKWMDVPVRIGGVLVGMGRFFVWGVPFTVVWMVVLIVAFFFALRARKGLMASASSSLAMPMRRISLGLFLSFGAQVALFLAFRSPAGAMRAKYLVLDYSLFACVVAGVLVYIVKSRRVERIVAGMMFVSSILALGAEIQRRWQMDASMPVVVSARRIVFESIARGSLPVAMWSVPPDKPVFAANHSEILARRDHLFLNLEPGTLIVVDPARGTAQGRAIMLEAVSKQYRIEESRPAVFGERIVYTLRERTTTQP